MDNRPFESMEDFASRCRKDGMDSFIAFAGCEDGHKRACIGEGEAKDACLAIASCMYDRDDIYNLVINALKATTGMREKNGKETPFVGVGYLQDWHRQSIDGTQPPAWTDDHLNELSKDFRLLPKGGLYE